MERIGFILYSVKTTSRTLSSKIPSESSIESQISGEFESYYFLAGLERFVSGRPEKRCNRDFLKGGTSVKLPEEERWRICYLAL